MARVIGRRLQAKAGHGAGRVERPRPDRKRQPISEGYCEGIEIQVWRLDEKDLHGARYY